MSIRKTSLGLIQFTLFLAVLPTVGAVAQSVSRLDQTVTGFTEPYRLIEVAAPEMGTVSKIAVIEGETVSVGTLLAQLDVDVLQASLAMIKQSLEATGKLNSAFAELRMHESRMIKLKGLHQRNHASQIEIDRAQAQLEIAQAQVDTVRDELRVKSYELKRIEAQIEQRRLRSPINGIVTRVLKEQSEFVSPNDPVVIVVVQLDPLLVVLSVPQAKAHPIKPGQVLPITIGDNPSPVDGIVEFVSPTVDAQSGTCRVKIRIDNPDSKWPSGEVCKWTPPGSASSFASSQPTRSNQRSSVRSTLSLNRTAK